MARSSGTDPNAVQVGVAARTGLDVEASSRLCTFVGIAVSEVLTSGRRLSVSGFGVLSPWKLADPEFEWWHRGDDRHAAFAPSGRMATALRDQGRLHPAGHWEAVPWPSDATLDDLRASPSVGRSLGQVDPAHLSAVFDSLTELVELGAKAGLLRIGSFGAVGGFGRVPRFFEPPDLLVDREPWDAWIVAGHTEAHAARRLDRADELLGATGRREVTHRGKSVQAALESLDDLFDGVLGFGAASVRWRKPFWRARCISGPRTIEADFGEAWDETQLLGFANEVLAASDRPNLRLAFAHPSASAGAPTFALLGPVDLLNALGTSGPTYRKGPHRVPYRAAEAPVVGRR